MYSWREGTGDKAAALQNLFNEIYIQDITKRNRVKNIGELTKQQMIDTGYINPRHDAYLCYFFDEEITLGEFDIKKIIEADRMKHEADSKQKKEYAEGQPVYMSGKELINYRK